MAISIISSSSVIAGSATPAINTTGADLIVIACAQFAIDGTPSTLTDSAGNTWGTPFLTSTEATAGNGQFGFMFFLHNPTTSASHTFTCTNGSHGSIAVVAASGSATSPLDQQGFTVWEAGGITSETPGSVTPTQSGELCVAAYAIDTPSGSTFSVNSGYTLQQHIDVVPGGAFGIVLATLVQTSAAATNPALTRAALTGGDVAMIATFKAVATASPVVQRRSTALSGTRVGSRQMIRSRWKRSPGGVYLREAA